MSTPTMEQKLKVVLMTYVTDGRMSLKEAQALVGLVTDEGINWPHMALDAGERFIGPSEECLLLKDSDLRENEVKVFDAFP